MVQQQQIQTDERALGEDETGQEHAQPLLQLQRVVRGGRREGVGGGGGRGPSRGEDLLCQQSQVPERKEVFDNNQSAIKDILSEDAPSDSGDSEIGARQI